MAKDDSDSNSLNLAVVGLVALVAIVGLVALVLNASSLASIGTVSTGGSLVAADDENAAGQPVRNMDFGDAYFGGAGSVCKSNLDCVCEIGSGKCKSGKCTCPHG